MEPLISIITVVYNAAETLEETIKSVITQKYQRLEYIIIDGGSTDGTLDIIKEYEDNLTKWISEKDKGIYDAMNKALQLVTGDRVYFLGADDTLRENILHNISDYLKDDKKVYYANVWYIHRKITYDGKFSKFKFALRNISHQAIFYPATAFKNQEFELRYKYLADYVFNLKLFGSGKFEWEYIPLTVANYNDGGSSGSNPDNQFDADRFTLLQSAFPFYVYYYAKMRSYIKKIVRNG
ncbi:glycosyltransferase family 2 protein [Chitinophaga sp. XS-30]|uniref:glycosyltransferase family 2 protein n=1 Tax=Chitinophaga sp. XS-30 TaxID=2604421 RepID=UPI0011DC7EAD|nr:glycosyltransferase family 2 protein [Chitinophaga sp. XS-30]QEH39758.1 glycosyltransferase [Chitinophaga sp. XS-30]